MAEPLKNHFGAALVRHLGARFKAVHPRFDVTAFEKHALKDFEPKSLTERGWAVAHALRETLPADYEEAVALIVKSLGPKHESTESFGMTPFQYMPHTFFVAHYGAEYFEASMAAQYELTQRFTAEFSIRTFLERHTEKTLARLEQWTRDPSAHVRRLVSEGTRPRLPWAPRLRNFQRDPTPVLKLLELLKDDPELYVRRSVANNLNDIGKDHPEVLMATCKRWQSGASSERQWIISHALRSAIKRGEKGAVDVLGFGTKPLVSLENVELTPKRAHIGGSVVLSFDVVSTASRAQELLVDFRVHFVKANGGATAKVFKLKQIALGPKAKASLKKKVSLVEMTTRKHYPGRHHVGVVINGVVFERVGHFELLPSR